MEFTTWRASPEPVSASGQSTYCALMSPPLTLCSPDPVVLNLRWNLYKCGQLADCQLKYCHWSGKCAQLTGSVPSSVPMAFSERWQRHGGRMLKSSHGCFHSTERRFHRKGNQPWVPPADCGHGSASFIRHFPVFCSLVSGHLGFSVDWSLCVFSLLWKLWKSYRTKVMRGNHACIPLALCLHCFFNLNKFKWTFCSCMIHKSKVLKLNWV